jgi:hypothetical protein
MIHAIGETDDINPFAASSRRMDPIWKGPQFENNRMVSPGMYIINCIRQRLSENWIASKHKTMSDEKRNRARFFTEQRIPFCNVNQITEMITSDK